LNNALKKQQGKGTPANAITTQGSKTAKNTRYLQRDLATVERTSVGGTPQATQASNPSPPK